MRVHGGELEEFCAGGDALVAAKFFRHHLMLSQQTVKGLSIDASSLRGTRDVAAVPIQRVAQIGGLEET